MVKLGILIATYKCPLSPTSDPFLIMRYSVLAFPKSLLYLFCCLVASQSTHVQAQNAGHAHTQGHFCQVAPPPDPRPLEQPDGSIIMGYIIRSNGLSYIETIDGFTILQDLSDGFFKYAVTTGDGDLYTSNILVSPIDRRTAEEKAINNQISKHLRYAGRILRQKNQQYQDFISNAIEGPSGVFPPAGNRRALLLLIDFPDQVATYSNNNFDNLANQPGYNVNGNSGSFRDYYKDMSYNNLIVDTDVRGWYRASNNKATYGNANGTAAARPLIREAVDAAEADGVDFSQYDGDNDGRVDVVMVIHSGRGAEESGNGADIWSHRWALNSSQQVVYDGVRIFDYIIQPEKYGTTNITNIGVLCHEFGHALGLPDLYDTDGSSSGVGKWCCMAAGTWNNSGKTPAQMSIWCKEKLGWISPGILDGSGSISNMKHTDIEATGYRYNTPISNEYFLLENRQKTGWDQYIPGEGLLVYHIDENQSTNANENQPLVLLEQADGDQDLQNKSNNGDTGDPFPGSTSNTGFSATSNPNSNNYGGGVSGVNIYAVNSNADLINFNYGSMVACNGTPSPGNTLSTETSPCMSDEFTLSLSAAPNENGITYQWETSVDNIQWAFIPGAETKTHQTTLSTETWFRCKVTCTHTGSSGYSSPLLLSPEICYCDAGANSTGYEKISRIQFHTIDHVSSATSGYEDFTEIYASVVKGSAYAFSATISGAYSSDQILVWVDFNQNGDFTDPGELVYTSVTGVGPHATNITIPVTALSGTTRMRIRLHDTGAQPNASSCGQAGYGQVEDYTLILSESGGNCDETKTLSSPTDDVSSGLHVVEASNKITATNQVTGGQVVFNAGQAIELMPNFKIDQGAQLTVMTDGCN